MPPQFENKIPPHKHTLLILLTTAIVLVGILAVWYFWYQNKQTPAPVENQTTQQPIVKDNDSVSSPKDVYFAYRAELAQAKNPTDIKNVISKYSPQKSYQELLNQLSSSPTDYQNSIFDLIKNISVGITNITVVSQEVTDSKATFKLSAYDSNDQRNTSGTLVMVKENGSWKIDYEEWKSVPLK